MYAVHLCVSVVCKTESSYWHHLHLTRGILGKNSLSCSCMKDLTPEGTETHIPTLGWVELKENLTPPPPPPVQVTPKV